MRHATVERMSSWTVLILIGDVLVTILGVRIVRAWKRRRAK